LGGHAKLGRSSIAWALCLTLSWVLLLLLLLLLLPLLLLLLPKLQVLKGH
jgi:hypothetical protein